MSNKSENISTDRIKQLVFDSTVEGIWTIGLDGLITTVNKSAIKMFGYESAEEMVGKNSHELVHYKRADGSHYEQMTCPIFLAFRKGKPCHLEDEVLWRKDGSFFYADYRSVPIFDNESIVGAAVTFLDNTEKRKHQEEIMLNREWLRSTLRGIGDAVITSDASAEPKITFLNPIAESLTGWSVESAVGKDVAEVFKIVNQKTRKPSADPVMRVLSEKIIVGLENHTVLISRSGKEFIIEDSAAPILNANNEVQGVVLIFRDVTSKNESQYALKISEANLARVVSVSQIGFYDWDATNNLVSYSDQMKVDWGLNKSESLEQGLSRIHADDLERVKVIVQNAIQNHSTFQIEFRVLKPDKNVAWIEAQGEITYNKEGHVSRIFGTSLNITEKKQTSLNLEKLARKLVNERQKLELMISESPAAIALMAGPDLIFERVNAKWLELAGERDYRGRAYKNVYPELVGSDAHKSIQQVFESGVTSSAIEMKLRVQITPDEFEDRYYDYTCIRISDSDGVPYGVFCHALNVTEKVLSRLNILEKTKSLGVSVEQLKEEREMRERFVATLTHDLRTPLTSARLSAQLMIKKHGDNKTIAEMSERIIRSLDRSDRMIRDLLDANRIKAGEGLPVFREPIELNSLIKESIRNLETIHKVKLEIKSNSSEINVQWDPSGTVRILENLVSNAVKYGASGHFVTIALTSSEKSAQFSVHNEGAAISEEDTKTLFDPYQRSNSAKSGAQKGWGIGLTLVKGVAEAHGGRVWVESSKDKGTTFFVEMPNCAGTSSLNK